MANPNRAQNGGWQGEARRLQGQITALRNGLSGGGGGTLPVALELGPSPSTSRPNGVASLLLAKPDQTYPNTSAVTIKREDATWASGSAYGAGQALLLLSPSTQAASDTTGDGSSGNNPVLARLDAYGGLGLANGLHIAPGLRNNYGGPNPGGAWVQRFIDTFGFISSAPDPGAVPTPLLPHFLAETYTGTQQWAVNSQGAAVTYADDGVTAVSGVYPGDTGNSGYRSVLYTKDPNTGALGIRTAPSQVSDAITVFDSTGTKAQGGLGRDGRSQVYGDDGNTIVGAMYPSDLGNSGFRQILLTKNKNTGGTAYKLATGQIADVIQTVDANGTVHTIIDANSRMRAGIGFASATAPASTATVQWWMSVFNTSVNQFGRVAVFV